MVSGTGFADVHTGRRALRSGWPSRAESSGADGFGGAEPDVGGASSSHPVTDYTRLRLPRRRATSLVPCSSCSALVYGDLDGDCTFSSGDLLAMQRLQVEIGLIILLYLLTS